MADCNETLKELERYLDSELPSERVNDIIGHLKGCTDCQSAYEFHADLRNVIRVKALRDDLPEGFMERLAGCFGDDLMGAEQTS